MAIRGHSEQGFVMDLSAPLSSSTDPNMVSKVMTCYNGNEAEYLLCHMEAEKDLMALRVTPCDSLMTPSDAF